MVKLVLFLLFIGCAPNTPHRITKAGQAKIDFTKLHTSYYVNWQLNEARTDFKARWEGRANTMMIQVDFIVRPTSPQISFPLHSQYLFGNHYTVYRDLINIRGMNEFEGTINIYQRGDYIITAYIMNEYWTQSRSSRFKVQ